VVVTVLTSKNPETSPNSRASLLIEQINPSYEPTPSLFVKCLPSNMPSDFVKSGNPFASQHITNYIQFMYLILFNSKIINYS
jgi:hypothetical protein